MASRVNNQYQSIFSNAWVRTTRSAILSVQGQTVGNPNCSFLPISLTPRRLLQMRSPCRVVEPDDISPWRMGLPMDLDPGNATASVPRSTVGEAADESHPVSRERGDDPACWRPGSA